MGSGVDDYRHGDRFRNISCSRRGPAVRRRFRSGRVDRLAGRRRSLAARRAHLRGTERHETACWWPLRLFARLLWSLPCFSFRLDVILCRQLRLDRRVGGGLWQLSWCIHSTFGGRYQAGRGHDDSGHYCGEYPGYSPERRPTQRNNGNQSYRHRADGSSAALARKARGPRRCEFVRTPGIQRVRIRQRHDQRALGIRGLAICHI